jgi:pSer/pThr/pTyr-binding forkhead associated (FHA) protein
VSQAGELEVEDLDSTNGTFVNDQRVRRATLNAGDRLRVGRVELAVTRES